MEYYVCRAFYCFLTGGFTMKTMTSVEAAFHAAVAQSDVAREIVRKHEARETLRTAKRQQAAWWRWKERQEAKA